MVGCYADSCGYNGLSTLTRKHCVVGSDLRWRGEISGLHIPVIVSINILESFFLHACPRLCCMICRARLLQAQSNTSSGGSSANGALGQVGITDVPSTLCYHPCNLESFSRLRPHSWT